MQYCKPCKPYLFIFFSGVKYTAVCSVLVCSSRIYNVDVR